MKSALLALVPVLFVAVVVVAVSALDTSESEEPRSRARAGSSGTILLTTNRDQLQICVDVLDVSFAEVSRAIPVIEEAWPQVAQHPLWERWWSDLGPPTLHVRCPGEPSVTDGWIVAPTPSEYRIWVFVTDKTTIEENRIDFQSGRLAAQELLNYGGQGDDVFSQVTTGLYLTPEEFGSSCVVALYLTRALGLEREPVDEAACYL